jgi:uncharacterized coiled-coil protein SlyX
VVAFHDPGSDTITRLPDPEWDRIDALERHIERMDRRIRMLQDKLESLGERVAEQRPEGNEPVHLHLTRDPADGEGGPSLPSREAVGR